MTIEIAAPREALDEKMRVAARAIFDVLSQRAKLEPLVIGLCGGRSVVGLLGALLTESREQPRDILERIQFFMVDERIVPLTDAQSNFGSLKELFFDKLLQDGSIRSEQLHPFVGTLAHSQEACRGYAAELERFGGRFDVVVLGMGEDGHVAGLFPHHPLLEERSRGFLAFSDSPKPPPERMTASASLVCASTLSILLALGEGKRAAWDSFKNPARSVAECPAKMVLDTARCLVVTDLADGD